MKAVFRLGFNILLEYNILLNFSEVPSTMIPISWKKQYIPNLLSRFLYSLSAAFVLSIAAFVPTDDQSNPGSQNSSA